MKIHWRINLDARNVQISTYCSIFELMKHSQQVYFYECKACQIAVVSLLSFTNMKDNVNILSIYVYTHTQTHTHTGEKVYICKNYANLIHTPYAHIHLAQKFKCTQAQICQLENQERWIGFLNFFFYLSYVCFSYFACIYNCALHHAMPQETNREHWVY